jgi:hypothetical protein
MFGIGEVCGPRHHLAGLHVRVLTGLGLIKIVSKHAVTPT